jgi:hypothetical protein
MDSGTPPRTLGIGQRIFLAVACQLWLWANLFSQTIAGRELAGLSLWFSTAKLVPVAGFLALAGVIYCFFKAPTRIMLLLYTVSFVAGMRAIALMLSAQGNSEPRDFGTLTIVEAVASMIYPLVFIFRGRYTPVPATELTTEPK